MKTKTTTTTTTTTKPTHLILTMMMMMNGTTTTTGITSSPSCSSSADAIDDATESVQQKRRHEGKRKRKRLRQRGNAQQQRQQQQAKKVSNNNKVDHYEDEKDEDSSSSCCCCYDLALVPLRNGKRLLNNRSKKNDDNDDKACVNFLQQIFSDGFITLLSSKLSQQQQQQPSNNNSCLTLGRYEVLTCLYGACGCDDNDVSTHQHGGDIKINNHETQNTNSNTNKIILSTQRDCIDCQQINSWSLHLISRKLLRITTKTSTKKTSDDNDSNTAFQMYYLQVRGIHTLISIDSKPINDIDIDDANDNDDANEWSKDYHLMKPGMKISIRPRNRQLDDEQQILEFEVVKLNELLLQSSSKSKSTSTTNNNNVTTEKRKKVSENQNQIKINRKAKARRQQQQQQQSSDDDDDDDDDDHKSVSLLEDSDDDNNNNNNNKKVVAAVVASTTIPQQQKPTSISDQLSRTVEVRKDSDNDNNNNNNNNKKVAATVAVQPLKPSSSSSPPLTSEQSNRNNAAATQSKDSNNNENNNNNKKVAAAAAVASMPQQQQEQQPLCTSSPRIEEDQSNNNTSPIPSKKKLPIPSFAMAQSPLCSSLPSSSPPPSSPAKSDISILTNNNNNDDSQNHHRHNNQSQNNREKQPFYDILQQAEETNEDDEKEANDDYNQEKQITDDDPSSQPCCRPSSQESFDNHRRKRMHDDDNPQQEQRDGDINGKVSTKLLLYSKKRRNHRQQQQQQQEQPTTTSQQQPPPADEKENPSSMNHNNTNIVDEKKPPPQHEDQQQPESYLSLPEFNATQEDDDEEEEEEVVFKGGRSQRNDDDMKDTTTIKIMPSALKPDSQEKELLSSRPPPPRFGDNNNNNKSTTSNKKTASVSVKYTSLEGSSYSANSSQQQKQQRERGPKLKQQKQTDDCNNSKLLSKQSSHDSKTKGDDDNDFTIFICPLGQDLPSMRQKVLAQQALNKGAISVLCNHRNLSFPPKDNPKYWVVSTLVPSLQPIADLFKIKLEYLINYINSNSIKCVVPKWISDTKDGNRLQPPTPIQWWHGFSPKLMSKKCPQQEQLRRDSIIDSAIARKKLSTPIPINQEISDKFKELGNLHQECPLLASDMWKGYCFRVVAGRIKGLNFPISYDTLQRASKVKGIGDSCKRMIQQYLDTGTIYRVEEFKKDPKRIAIKRIKEIWGIGRVKAADLVQSGYLTIHDVYKGIKGNKITLDRNQLVGADCYEDFLENMTRSEVEVIGGIIERYTHQFFPGAQVTVMGSYRRGKPTCGDVDVHITHPSYYKDIPEHALGKIVDALWQKDHIAFHLTYVEGMTTGFDWQDFQRSSRHIPMDAWDSANPPAIMSSRGKGKYIHQGFSYMGVFHSPIVENRRRRVDIKFYPYRERTFASLYFTGNGFFNRSMRLWARKFNYSLNDHGLFRAGTKDRVMHDVSEEKEVFDKLGLVYKTPTERDCFDAVVPLASTDDSGGDGENAVTKLLEDMTEKEFYQDIEHAWVN